MSRKTVSSIVLALVAVFVVGCGSSSTPTPASTQPPLVITVVITPTPLPATATPAQPTLTPIPTVGLTPTVPTAVSVATKPPVVRTPTKPATPPTATALPLKFGAPSLNRPIWTENQKDEAKFPGGAIVFDWQSVGGLNGDECYLLQANTEPVNPGPGIGLAADSWVVYCGDQTPKDRSVKFTLESPNRAGSQPNYSSLLINAGQMWTNWSITVVKNLGECDPSYQYHCKTAPISPAGRGRFLFKGN